MVVPQCLVVLDLIATVVAVEDPENDQESVDASQASTPVVAAIHVVDLAVADPSDVVAAVDLDIEADVFLDRLT